MPSIFKTKKVRKKWLINLEYEFSKTFKFIIKFIFGGAIAIAIFWGTINYGSIERNLPIIDQKWSFTDVDWSKEPNRMEVPSLNLFAKVAFEVVPNDEYKFLDQSVVHLGDSSHIGEIGNVIITGHSSSNTGGYYSNIFAGLNRLGTGDEILVYKDSKKFKYIVKEKITILPTDIDKLPKGEATLSLVTCWPLGTDLKRLVVVAEYEKESD